VQPGNQAAAGHGFAGLWALLDRLPVARRPHLLRGECAYGQEALLCGAETREINYLCKLRRTAKARELVAWLERDTVTKWTDAGQGWEGADAVLCLQGWSRSRRVVILRRRLNDQRHPRARRRLAREQARQGLLLSAADAAACEPVIYEHQILVTSLPYEILTLATLYRERGDAENPFDGLKNQWSWAGFTTHDLRSCQHAARLAALAYNWWTLYHRLLQPGQHVPPSGEDFCEDITVSLTPSSRLVHHPSTPRPHYLLITPSPRRRAAASFNLQMRPAPLAPAHYGPFPSAGLVIPSPPIFATCV